MSILAREFEIPEIAEVFGIPAATIHSWRRRDYLVGHKGGGVRGKPVFMSFYNAMETGIGSAILSAGVSDAGAAFAAASAFAHFADGPLPGRPIRRLGLPFHPDDGLRTYFYFAPSNGRMWEGTERSDTVEQVRLRLLSPLSFVTVDVSGVFYRICAFLGRSPGEVLDEEYGRIGI